MSISIFVFIYKTSEQCYATHDYVAACTLMSVVDHEKVSLIRTDLIFAKIGSPLPRDTDEDTQIMIARCQCEIPVSFLRNLTVTPQRKI